MNYFEFLHLRTPLQSLKKAYKSEEKSISLFNEGLFLASPEYWKQYQKHKLSDKKESEKIKTTFDKYWLRSCSRCTPFGTFAGSTLAIIDNQKTNLVLNDSKHYRRAVRLDMNYLYTIIRNLEKVPAIERQIKLFKNNSIYETSLSYRYAEYSISNNIRKYHLATVEKTDYIDRILDMANSGASISDLSDMLAVFTKSTYEEAYEFIKEMWGAQLLVSDLEPCVTGTEPFQLLRQKLKEFTDIPLDLKELAAVSDMLNNITDIQSYVEIEKHLEKIFKVPLPKNTIQVDLILTLKDNNIEKSIIDSLFRQLKDLSVFSRLIKSATLDNFKVKFLEKFEEREIPLNIALDAELGVGYTGLSNGSIAGSEWIDDIAFLSPNNNTEKIEFDVIQQYSLNKFQEYLKGNQDCIEIQEDELSNFNHNLHSYYPNSMYIVGSFLKENGKFDDKNYLFDFNSLGGPSGANLLGRFTFGDKQLERFTKTIIKEEENQNPEVIYAEIAHLPEERIGNILLRPVLRNYEIPYLGRSGANRNNQIPIDDLMVRVINDEVIITSKRLKKRILPRLTTAHNFSNSTNLPIYKFLCDIQYQGVAFPSMWDWGILNKQKHLPRVVYKNIILKKARWILEINDITELSTKKYFTAQKVINILKDLRFPQNFVITQGDNKLLINLEQTDSVNILIEYIRKFKQIEVEEFLFNENNCIIHNENEEPFTHEVIIPYKNNSSKLEKKEFISSSTKIKNRKFGPGSEWLYFKIYCGSKIAEQLLSETIYNFIERSLAKKDFEQFFFLRYKDSAPHIRIRFYNSNPSLLSKVQTAFMKILQPFMDDELIHSIVIDTYNQELERYDAELIEDAEKLFFHDSLAVLRMLQLLEGTKNEKFRILLALRGIDQLLDDFNFSIAEKLTLLRRISEGMIYRFGNHPSLKSNINIKYKKFQKTVFQYMNRENDVANKIEQAILIFTSRSEMNSNIIESLCSKISKENIHEKLNALLPSFIHMFVNRFFIAQQLKYEVLIYIFLERYYTSISAIKRKALQKDVI